MMSLLLFQGAAEARGPGKGGGPMKEMGMGHGMGGNCAVALMHAHPDVLKAKLGLNDSQIAQIQSTRVNFLSKQIKLRSQVQQDELQMGVLFQADLPDQAKVLDLQRKIRGLRGQIAEERIKTHLKFLQILTKDQRAFLRTHCPPMGGGMGQGGKGWGHEGGKDWKHGWGAGGGDGE